MWCCVHFNRVYCQPYHLWHEVLHSSEATEWPSPWKLFTDKLLEAFGAKSLVVLALIFLMEVVKQPWVEYTEVKFTPSVKFTPWLLTFCSPLVCHSPLIHCELVGKITAFGTFSYELHHKFSHPTFCFWLILIIEAKSTGKEHVLLNFFWPAGCSIWKGTGPNRHFKVWKSLWDCNTNEEVALTWCTFISWVQAIPSTWRRLIPVSLATFLCHQVF